MTEPSPPRTAAADIVKRVEEWQQRFAKLLKMHNDYVSEFNTLARELQHGLGWLQALADLFLPFAVAADESPAAGGPAPQGAASSAAERAEPDAPLKPTDPPQPNEAPDPAAPAPPAPPDPPPLTDRADDTERAHAQEQAAVQTTKELRQRYPNYDKLHSAAVKAKGLLPEVAAPVAVVLERVVAAFQNAGRKIAPQSDQAEACQEVLHRQATDLLNALQELDKLLDPTAPRNAHLIRISDVRELLWAFVQAATNNEYKAVCPPENADIGEWARKNNWRPEEKFFENTRVNSMCRKDSVVRTLRPGYVQMSADKKHVLQVVAKAVVQISTGSLS